MGWGILAFLISPLLAGIFLLISKDLAEQKAAVDAAALQASFVRAADVVGTLTKQRGLLDAGVLSAEEFATRKAHTLLALGKKTPVETPEDFLAAFLPVISNRTLTEDDVAKVKEFAFRPRLKGQVLDLSTGTSSDS
jgi:hypothetical protein